MPGRFRPGREAATLMALLATAANEFVFVKLRRACTLKLARNFVFSRENSTRTEASMMAT
jgi:hypothetical protein